jgi:glucosamine 6-phosphate synthetase-like amidotransferase/phosphosugar isomerase protein
VKHTVLGDYVKEKVPSLKHFMSKEIKEQEYNIPSLAALSNAMRSLQRCKKFNRIFLEWI